MTPIVFVRMMLVALAVFAGVTSVSAQQAKPAVEVRSIIPPPPGSLGEQLAKQEVGKKPSPVTLSDEQARVIERAEEIKRERAERQAQRELKKSDTPEMKEARREIEKERREEEKQAKADRQIDQRASVLGCGPETQVLTEKAEQKRGAFGRSAEVTLVNSSDISWNIRTDSRYLGHIVKDLCVGGSLGLHFTRSFWQNLRETSQIQSRGSRRNMMETIVLVATAAPIVDANGTVKVPRPQTFRIRLNRRTNEVSTTGVFELRGTYLPRVRTPRVRP